MHRLFLTTLLFGLLGPAAALAADDDLDDVLGDDGKSDSSTIRDERKSLENGDEKSTSVIQTPDDKKRVIKTLQRKTFLKLGRYEAAPHIGFVTNDPFINRYLIGASFGYHVTEVLAVELEGSYSPDFGEGDWKPITDQIVNENQVTPDISKIEFYANGTLSFSPIYGKVSLLGRGIIMFDIYGLFGTGIVNTRDDLQALQKETDQIAINTESQLHPTLNFGGGLRVVLSDSFALRVEGRGLSYIEVLESSTLEMKNNVMLLAGASFFFPGLE